MTVGSFPKLLPILVVTLIVFLHQNGIEAWYTEYDAGFNFECPDGQALSHLNSEFSRHRGDRRWTFGCRSVHAGVTARNCTWTGWVNEWRGPLDFQCSTDHVITGIDSYHCNFREDRRFKFKCCRHSDLITTSCRLTSFKNNWGRILDYTVSSGKVLHGISSVRNNHQEDRRWKFKECDPFLN